MKGVRPKGQVSEMILIAAETAAMLKSRWLGFRSKAGSLSSLAGWSAIERQPLRMSVHAFLSFRVPSQLSQDNRIWTASA